MTTALPCHHGAAQQAPDLILTWGLLWYGNQAQAFSQSSTHLVIDFTTCCSVGE